MPFVLALFYRRQIRLFNFTGHRPLATGYRPPFSRPTRYAQLRDKSRAVGRDDGKRRNSPARGSSSDRASRPELENGHVLRVQRDRRLAACPGDALAADQLAAGL
jgi:hypothetical protein